MRMELTRDADLIESLYRIPSKSPIFRGNLTKRLLWALPTGAYVASNVGETGVGPLVRRQVPAIHDREETWEVVKEAGVAGQGFTVFNNEAAFEDYVEAYRRESAAGS